MQYSKLELRQLKLKLVENAKLRREAKKDCYVYSLLDPRKPGPFIYGHWKFSHEPFYIGIATKENRIDIHSEKHKSNPFKANKIAKIKHLGFEDCIRIKKLEKITWKKACELEIKLIAKIGRRDLKMGPLTNLTNGGDGVVFLNHKTKRIKELRRQDTRSKWTLEKKAEIDSKRIATIANRSPEEKTRRAAKQKETISSKSLEEKTKIIEKYKTTLSKKSPEEKAQTNLKIKTTLITKSSEEKAKILARYKITLNNKTPEEKAKGYAKCWESRRANKLKASL
jgi:hypothetical protein